MLWIFKAFSNRLKALFVADVAADFEAQLLTRDAERKADLLRQANSYDQEGMHLIAESLRQRAESISLEKPLAASLPAVEHLCHDHLDRAMELPPGQLVPNALPPFKRQSKRALPPKKRAR